MRLDARGSHGAADGFHLLRCLLVGEPLVPPILNVPQAVVVGVLLHALAVGRNRSGAGSCGSSLRVEAVVAWQWMLVGVLQEDEPKFTTIRTSRISWHGNIVLSNVRAQTSSEKTNNVLATVRVLGG